MIHDLNQFSKKQLDFLIYTNSELTKLSSEKVSFHSTLRKYKLIISEHLTSPLFGLVLCINGVIAGGTLFIENGIEGMLSRDGQQLKNAFRHLALGTFRGVIFTALGFVGFVYPSKVVTLADNINNFYKKHLHIKFKAKRPQVYGSLTGIIMRIVRGFTCSLRDIAYSQSRIFLNVNSNEPRYSGNSCSSIIKPVAGLLGMFSESTKKKIEIAWFSFWIATRHEIAREQWLKLFEKNPSSALEMIGVEVEPSINAAYFNSSKPVPCSKSIKKLWLLEKNILITNKLSS